MLDFARRDDGQDLLLVATLKPAALKAEQELAIKQNITTLNRRVNQLGVAEPVIQQQGADRIVVQLPGVQDTAKAKDILGRTATLEVRLVDEEAYRSGSTFNVDVFPERKRDGSVSNVPVKKQVLVTGDQFVGAQATFGNDQRPAVSVELNEAGGRIMRQATRENLRKLMAIILIEKGKGEAISVATIQGEFGVGNREASDARIVIARLQRRDIGGGGPAEVGEADERHVHEGTGGPRLRLRGGRRLGAEWRDRQQDNDGAVAPSRWTEPTHAFSLVGDRVAGPDG